MLYFVSSFQDNNKISMVPASGSKVLLSVPNEHSVQSIEEMDEVGCLNKCFFSTVELKSCYYNPTESTCNVANGTAFLLVDNKVKTNDPATGLRKSLLNNDVSCPGMMLTITHIFSIANNLAFVVKDKYEFTSRMTVGQLLRAVSLLKTPFLCFHQDPSFELTPGCDFISEQLSNQKVANLDTCNVKCNNTFGCLRFCYDPSTRACQLSHRLPTNAASGRNNRVYGSLRSG